MRKQVLVTVDRGETRVAILEGEGNPRPKGSDSDKSGSGRGRRGSGAKQNGNGDLRVAELSVERRGNRSIVGNVYLGKVDNVLPGLEAAFVDVGLDRNGFLHADDVIMPGVKIARRGRGGRGKQIHEILKPGDEVVVQASKDPLKSKGARLTMEISIAGRYLVYQPDGEGIGVSKRLDDAERERLRKESKKVDLGKGGAIVRTAAHGATAAELQREVRYLHRLHEVLQDRVKKSAAPALVFQEADLSVRVVRDIYSQHFERALVDDEGQHQRLKSFLTRTAPELVDRVELYEGEEPMFDRYGVEGAYRSTLNRRVDLPSGGYLMIDYAEAMTVIDVNTGSFIGRGKGVRLEDTIVKTNLEAAEETVRQLRLRDIGGIIVIDFIDMSRQRNRDAVLKTLRSSLDQDRTRSQLHPLSPLGLVEMTRQNVSEGVREQLTKRCPTCDGEGVVLSEETVAIDIERRLRELVVEEPAPEAYLVQVHPAVASELLDGPGRPLLALEEEIGKHFHFEGGESLPIDHFAVTLTGTRDEVEARALPFREGEELLVKITEPHMYDEDDAVGKVDGYVISVKGAGKLVGESRLVRIEKVARTAATATIVGGAPEAAADDDDGSDEGDGSGRGRRRGRRGGRGRRRPGDEAPEPAGEVSDG